MTPLARYVSGNSRQYIWLHNRYFASIHLNFAKQCQQAYLCRLSYTTCKYRAFYILIYSHVEATRQKQARVTYLEENFQPGHSEQVLPMGRMERPTTRKYFSHYITLITTLS